MAELGPSNGTLTIHTARQGMAARAGHDLVIEVQRWSVSFDPSGVKGTFDPNSLVVREGLGGVRALTDKDKADIQKTLTEKILKTSQHPEVTFEAGPASGADGGTARIDGRLTLAGATNPLQVPITIEPGDSEVVLKTTVQVVQTQFGIKPYTGLMGALKVADAVEVRGAGRIPRADWPF